MNKIKYMTMLGAAMLLTSMGFISCDDTNDWDVDSSHDRLFSTNKIAVESDVFDATVTFKTTPNTSYYIIELSKDSLYDELAMGATESSIVFGKDKRITTSPYTLTNLEKNTQYYIRMKSMSDAKESHWSYLEKFTFKTKMEQIMSKFTKTSKSVKLEWNPGYTLTSIEVIPENADSYEIDIRNDQEAQQNCTYEITGLTPLTKYTVYLKNGDDIKGYAEFQTNADIPDADKVIDLAEGDVLSQTLLEEVALELGANADNLKTVTITIPAGIECPVLNENNEVATLAIPDGLAVNFYGNAGEEKAILKVGGLGDSGTASTTSFKVGGKHLCITFYNLIIDGAIDETQKVLSVIDQGDACSIGTISFEECELKNYARCLLRMQKTETKMVNQLIVKNSIVHKFGGNNYSFVQAKGGEGIIDEIEFTNSTFYDFQTPMKSFILFENNNDVKKINISDCTFYNIIGDGQYFIDFKDASYGADELNVINCIMGKTLTEKAKGGRGKKYDIIDSYKTTDWSQTGGNAIAGFTDYEGSSNDLFKDPVNGDFSIKDVLFAGYNKCGDPRWYSE